VLQSDEEGGTTDHLREKFAVFVLVQKRQFLSVWFVGVWVGRLRAGSPRDCVGSLQGSCLCGETAHMEWVEVCDV